MAADGAGRARWWLVVVAALVMGTAGVYQFGWSSIRGPLAGRIGAAEPALGTVFTLFVVCQTLSQFPAGWVRDRWGPRGPLLAGAALLAGGFAGTAVAGSVPAAAASYALGGVGAGIAYTVAVNTPVKWFDERRGLATGAVTMSYSGVSFLLIPFVRGGAAGAFVRTLLALSALAGVAALAGAVVLRDPAPAAGGGGDDADANADADAGAAGEADPDGSTDPDDGTGADPGDDPGAGPDDDPEPDSDDGAGTDPDDGTGAGPDDGAGADPDDGAGYTWREAVRTWQFWLLYGVFAVVNGVGLMVIGKVVAFAGELGLPAAAATAAASAVALADAAGVAVGGGLSDVLGRGRTVAGTLVLCGASLAGAVLAGEGGLAPAFVVLVGAAAFFRSPPFAVFPSVVGDYYGRARSSENYAALYTAKLWGGLGGGAAASALVVAVGWSRAFALGAGFVALAGVAVAFLRPVE